MANLSQVKREQMISFLEGLKEVHNDDESLIAINQIEKELTTKKYGLIWEEHEEEADIVMKDNIPVFSEVPDKEINDTTSQCYNFLLEGDNLHSLKLLWKTHKGKIDFIYIDPPYNTKNKEFIYSDTCIGLDDGFRHSKWLSFMSKRLQIARGLMTKDGLIFISIDENELAQLTMLCNEIFGEENYIDTIIYSIDRILKSLKSELRQKFDSLNTGITSEQFVVLDTISCYKNIYQQKLSDIIMKDKSNTTRIIKVLEQKGLITKEYGTINKRLVYFLKVTEKGKAIVKENMPKMKNFITEIFTTISDSEIELLHGLSSKFQADLANTLSNEE